MPDSVLQGIANLVAIGLERARTQDLAEQIEAARQSEQLRTTLIDAMAHEFKTPLTLIKAATTSLLSSPDEPKESRQEQLTIADEEAEHLRKLIDDAVEMARLDTTHIDVHPQISDVQETIRECVASMESEIDDRLLEIGCDKQPPDIAFDRRLMKLAIKQIIDNALKYSPADKPVAVRVLASNGILTIEITDHGPGVPVEEQTRIFHRFYRSPSVKDQIPGSGLGLTIARSIAQAHKGDLTVTSRPGETTFRITLPTSYAGDKK
jgi:two-component system sensor histidine kinase KdpD